MTECIRELPRVHLDPDAPPGPPPQRVLHAGRKNKTKQTTTSTLLIKIQGKFKVKNNISNIYKYSGCVQVI